MQSGSETEIMEKQNDFEGEEIGMKMFNFISSPKRKRKYEEEPPNYELLKKKLKRYLPSKFAIKQTQAFEGNVRSYVIELYKEEPSLENILLGVQDEVTKIIVTFVLEHRRSVKVVLELSGRTDRGNIKDLRTIKIFKEDMNMEQFFEEVKKDLLNILLYQQTPIREYYHLSVHLVKYRIDTNYFPVYLHGITNVQCDAVDSFRLAVISGLNPEFDTNVEIKQHYNQVKMDGIGFPIQLSDIPKFEEMNNLSLNIFSFKPTSDYRITGPIYHTNMRRETHINLLHVLDNLSFSHRYCCIKNLKEAINETRDGLVCDGCLNLFKNKEILNRHKQYCLQIETRLQENVIEFKNKRHENLHPIVVYAAFVAHSKRKSNTSHVVVGYSYLIKCSTSDFVPKTYMGQGDDCVQNFVSDLEENLKKLVSEYNKNNKTARIHFVPIYFDNFTKYHANHLIRGIQESPTDFVTVLGELDNYIMIQKTIKLNSKQNLHLRFLDSLTYLDRPLSKVSSLFNSADSTNFAEILKKCDNENEKLKLLQEGIETISIEPFDLIKIFKFNDKLNHILSVAKHFSCKSFSDYLAVRVESHVLFLADAFEGLRKFSVDVYKLDPAYYYNISNLSWDAVLKHTQVKLEPLSDIDMFFFIDRLKTELVYCSDPKKVEINDNLGKISDYKRCETVKQDCFKHAMSQPLPYGGFEWEDVNNFDLDKINEISSTSVGYIFEVSFSNPSGNPSQNTRGSDNQSVIMHHSRLSLCIQQGCKVQKIHRVLKFKQSDWLKPYIEMSDPQENVQSEIYKTFMQNMTYKTLEKISKREDNSTLSTSRSFCDQSKTNLANLTYGHDFQTLGICSESLVAVKSFNPKIYKMPRYLNFCITELAITHMHSVNINNDIMESVHPPNHHHVNSESYKQWCLSILICPELISKVELEELEEKKLIAYKKKTIEISPYQEEDQPDDIDDLNQKFDSVVFYGASNLIRNTYNGHVADIS